MRTQAGCPADRWPADTDTFTTHLTRWVVIDLALVLLVLVWSLA